MDRTIVYQLRAREVRETADLRRRAADFACRESAFVDTVFFGSRFSLRLIARERFADGRA